MTDTLQNLAYVLSTDPVPLLAFTVVGTCLYYAAKEYCQQLRLQTYRIERTWRNPR